METTNDVAALIDLVNDPELQKAIAHPEWSAAYESVLATMEDEMPFRSKDVDPAVLAAYVLSGASFFVNEAGRLASGNNRFPSGDYVWVDGEWVSEDEDDGGGY